MLFIGDIAKQTGLSVSTLRYYEKMGLLSPVCRTKGNVRQYDDKALERLNMLECLKNTGMLLKDIRRFFAWCDEGDSTLCKRYQMLLERKAQTQRQISLLQKELANIDFKCEYYRLAMQYGSVDAPQVRKLQKKRACDEQCAAQ